MKFLFFLTTDVIWNCFSELHKSVLDRGHEAVIFIGNSFYDPTNYSPERVWIVNSLAQEQLMNLLGLDYVNPNGLTFDESYSLFLSLRADVIITCAKEPLFFKATFNRSIEELISNHRFVYLPYYGSTQVNDLEMHTETYMHKMAWRIIADSDIYKEYLIESGFPEEKIINYGHPKIQEIYNIRKINSKWPILGNPRLKVIWAPHWSCSEGEWIPGGKKNKLLFGTFLSNYNDFIDYAKNNPDVHIIFRPHPMLTTWLKIRNNFQHYEKFIDEWKNLPNVMINESGLYNEMFAASDMLITDGISFLTEYPIATNKPLIFIDSGHHAEFNKIGLLGENYSIRVTGFSEIEELLNDPLKIPLPDSTDILNFMLPYKEKTSKMIIEKIEEDFRCAE